MFALAAASATLRFPSVPAGSLGAGRTLPVLSAIAPARRLVHVGRVGQSRPLECTADEAVNFVKSGDNVYVHGVAATPTRLMEAMVKRKDLCDVRLFHIHTEGPAPWVSAEAKGRFWSNSFFIGGNVRHQVQAGDAGFIPVFLSEIPSLFRRGTIPLDVAVVSVSPPDQHGWVTLGPSVDATEEAISCAKMAIAQVNPRMPRTHGAGVVHISAFKAIVHVDDPLPEREASVITPEETRIGQIIAEMVPDGACLQLGIGTIPDATLSQLTRHKRLGVHTEMMADGILPLLESGVITGEEKTNNKDLVVCTFALGSRALYDYMDDNCSIKFMRVSEVNNPRIIAENKKVHAINSCIEVDLSGQVCADSIGSMMYSGIGGQVDFLRGAALSEGGKPILAFTSTTKKGLSRIVPFLKQGAGVVTTRAHVHWVVTEWGAVNLSGKNLAERHRLLISIAHPDHREELERAAKEKLYLR